MIANQSPWQHPVSAAKEPQSKYAGRQTRRDLPVLFEAQLAAAADLPAVC